MTFAEYINKRLQELEYQYVFGVPGSYIMPIWQTFTDKPELVLARHESGAAFIADGWARITKKPGVVLTTIGPGITNVITGVANAYKDSVPLLVITGQAATAGFGSGSFQESFPADRGFAPPSLLQPVTKRSFEITDSSSAVLLFETALKTAVSGRPGPVHISVPLNIQTGEVCLDNQVKTDLTGKKRINEYTAVDSAIISALNSAKKPLFIAGGGCFSSDAAEELEKFSQKLSAPVITTLKGLTCIKESSPFFVGHVGPAQPHFMNTFLEEYKADTVLFLGTSLSSYYLNNIKDSLLKARTLIQVDIEAEQIGTRIHIDYEVQADIKHWLKAVFSAAEQKKNNKIVEKIGKYRKSIVNYKKEETGNFTIASAIRMLNRECSEDVVVVPDAGNHWLNTFSLYTPRCYGGIFTNPGLGTMGYAIGAAIGIKLGNPDKKVICITGDGSVLMSGNEISTAKALDLDITFIIFNNYSLGRVRAGQASFAKPDFIASDISHINLKKWAEGLGVNAYRVQSEKELLDVLNSSNKTTVIEVIVPKDEIPVFLQK